MRFLVFFLAAFAALVPAAASAGQVPVPAAPAQVPAPSAPAPGPDASSQQPIQLPATVCDLPVPAPSAPPPADSGPYVYALMPCFAAQGGSPVIDALTYLHYIELKNLVSNPDEKKWVPFTDQTEQVILADFKRLWATNFLDDLSIDVRDVALGNGVIGKLVIYNMEERQRIKIVDYVGSEKVDQGKIEEEMKKQGITLRIDSFIDQGLVRRVSGIVRETYAAKGYQFAEVKPTIKAMPGGPKLIHLTFNIDPGPQVKIRDVQFIGNKAVSDGRLEKQMKENKSRGWLSFITGGGTFKEDKFEDDADLIIEYYRKRGYITARVGQPDMKILEDENDGNTRWVELVVPVTEGNRYRIGKFDFEGNTIVKGEALRPLFKLDEGDYYNEEKIRKGLDKAREVYGSGGYYEFTAYPDLAPRDLPAASANDPSAANDPSGPPPPPAAPAAAETKPGPPVVDVTMRVQEGKQYFVNRITFLGNTTTRDNVIRRELRLVESGVFNTEALKYSVRRLNQLGYFKALEGDAIAVDKTPGTDNKVDVKLRFEEQNRNQLTFGAGVSQFEGFFGQLSFQTSNFLGRGETFTISAQQGSRAKNYQLAFSEPFLFDRPMTAGIDIFNREFEYIGLYTQSSMGGNLVYGFQVQDFARMFINYSFEAIRVKDLNPAFEDPRVLQGNPLLQESLLLGVGGRRTVSKIGPTYVYNTINDPIFPSTGKRLTASLDLAGLGGNTKFYNPRVEGIAYFQHTRRTSFGFRAQAEYIASYGKTVALPIFEKLFMGGEYSIRGFDLRTVGPRDALSGVVVGGNKSLLFNAEYLITIAGPVRLVLFADAGQVRDVGENFVWKETIFQNVFPQPDTLTLTDPFANVGLTDPNKADILPERVRIGDLSAFKSSIGAEIRFFMPVLNVPFRLIFAMNPSRGGILDNQLLPERRFKFRFAVGSTF
jgi:outer membrane protein insertion porin family